MALTILLEQIVWYNKSRKDARICAACRRFYYLGTLLPSLGGGDRIPIELDPANMERERRISGLCSYHGLQIGLALFDIFSTGTFLCFGVAAYNFPGVGAAWGRMESELDDRTAWILNNSPVSYCLSTHSSSLISAPV